MVRQLALPIEILPGDTVRAADGLALSSRNGYLTAAERAEAPRLHRVLRAAADRLAAGDRNLARIEGESADALRAAGWSPDYVAIRRQADLEVPGPADTGLVVLAAAKLGATRLIDNVEVAAPAAA